MADPKAIQFLEGIYSRVDKQVRDIVQSMLPNVTIAAQDDGTVVANDHRIVNFQGPGVTVTDDDYRRRVNVFIPGAPVASSTSAFVSAAGAEQTYNNGSSATGPAGWQTLAYNHSGTGWTASIANGGAGMPTPPSGAAYVANTNSAQAVDARHLFFRSFTLPAGASTSATLQLVGDDFAEFVWVNNTLVHSGSSAESTVLVTINVPSSVLIAGAANALAIQVCNGPGGFPSSSFMRLSYRLDVAGGTTGTDSRYQLLSEKNQANGYAGLDAGTRVPTAQLGSGTANSTTYLRGDQTWAAGGSGMTDPMTTAGDIIIRDGSNVTTRLGIGSSNQVLTVSSGVPAWAAAAGGSAFDGVRYTSNAGQSMTNNAFTIINFGTSVYDTNSRVTTGSSWHYTVGSGTSYVRVSAFAGLVSGSWSGAGASTQLGVFKNGSEITRLGAAFAEAVTSGNSNMSAGGSTVLNVANGDTIDIRMFQNCGAARNLDADHKTVWCAIEKVG